MAANKNLFEQLSNELKIAKDERPSLPSDKLESKDRPKILDDLTGNTPKPMFFHVSHNSHGNWNKHWAHGGYQDDKKPVLLGEEVSLDVGQKEITTGFKR